MNTFSKHSRDRDAKFYVSTSPARTGRSAWPGLCLPVAIALLFLLLMPMRLRAQSTQEYEQQKRERMDLLKKLGLITSDDQKPSDYRTENEGNPMSSKFTNLATVPEMYVYSSTYYNSSLKRTERFFYDNVNKKAELLDEVSPLQHLDNSAARIIKAVPLNVNKNAGANQEYTAELEAISATQFKVSIRNKDGAVNTSSYTHTFTVNDWSVMHNREKEQLFDYYFQIVSGDFNGDGCDDIAYYMPSMIKGTDMGGIGVHWIVQVVFLQRESNAIKQLGSVLSLGMTDNGLKNYWEFTPGIHLSVTNLNKDSSDDLVITRGWTKPANGLNNGKDGASTIYIYDNLKNRSTTPSFTRKLEETGNTFTDFNANIKEAYPYIWKCDITQEHTTGLMAVTTATGNVLSPDNRALVIAGYTIIKQTDGYYSDRYIGFQYHSGATHAEMYATFVGIAVLTYDFDLKKYSFRDNYGNNTDDFTYQITDQTATSRFVSYNMPAPIAMTAAKLTGSENKAHLMIDGSVYLMKENGFVTENGYNLIGVSYSSTYSDNNGNAQYIGSSGYGVPYQNTWIKQSVAGNATGNPQGQEHIYSLLNSYSSTGSYAGFKTFLIEYYSGRTSDNTLGFIPRPSVVQFRVDDIAHGARTSLCMQDVDASDGMVVEFMGRSFVYSNPKVLAVLAAAPYFADLADASESDNYTGAGETTFGTSITEGDEHAVRGGMYFEAYLQAGTDWPVASASVKGGIYVSAEYEFMAGWSQTASITRINDTPYDQVLLSVIPMDIVFYKVNGSECPMILNSPYTSREVMMRVSEYDAIAAQSPDLPIIRNNILYHTEGAPSTYNWVMPSVGGIIKKVKTATSHGVNVGSAGAQTKTVLGFDVTQDDSHTVSVEVGTVFEAEGKVIVGGGVRVEAYAGYGFTHFNSKATASTGSVANVTDAAGGSDFNFDWTIKGCVVTTKSPSGVEMEFPVLSYQTSNITRPLMPPSNLAVDTAGTTTNAIKLTWTKTTGSVQSQKLQYRQKGNTTWTILNDQIDPADSTYTHSGLPEGTTYEYRLCVISTDNYRESVYTPVCTAYTKVTNMPSFTTNVTDTTVNDGEIAKFSVVVQLGRGGQLDYQWEELLNNVWTTITNTNRDYYEIVATKYDDGRKFRCIATETKEGKPAVITSKTGELKVKKEDAAIVFTSSRNTGNITYNTTPGDTVKLEATVTSTSMAVGDKTGTVTFVIGLPGDTTSVTLIGAGETVGNSYVAKAKFIATYAGVHKITAAYSGNTNYQSAVSPDTDTAYYTATYPSGTKMLVLTDSDGKDYYDRATIRAVYGDSVLYRVSIAEIGSDGSPTKTTLYESDLTFTGTYGTYFSIAYNNTNDSIKFSCIAAGTSTPTLTYNDGTDYTFDLTLEGQPRPVTITVDNKEVYLNEARPTLTFTAENATDINTPDGRGFLATDEPAFLQFGDYLVCPTFDSTQRGTYPVEVTTPLPGTFDNYNLQISPAAVRVKGDEVTVDFGVAGSNNALLIGKAYNGAEYEMQLTSGGKVEKNLDIKFTLEVYDIDKYVAFWVVDNDIVPNTEGDLVYELTGYNDDVSVIANLDDSRYAVTYAATTADGSIQGYYSGTAPFSSGTELFAGTDLKFVATPNSGYVVKEWKVNGGTVSGNTSNELLITGLGGITAVVVVFEATTTCVVTFGVKEGSGTVTATVAGVPLISGSSVDGGTTVTFTAQPAAGQLFKRWYVNGVAGDNKTTYTATVMANLDVKAAFTSISAQKYRVTFSAEQLSGVNIGTVNATSGVGSVYSGSDVEEGNSIDFTATVRSAYATTHKLSHWVVDGVVVPKGNTNTYTHYLNADVTVRAIFVEIAAVVSVTPTGTDAPTNGSVAITFSCEMDISVSGAVVLEDASSQTIPLTGGVWSNNNKTYTVAYSSLSTSMAYTVDISDFEDADGNLMVANRANSFTTTASVTYGVSIIALTGGTVTPDKAAYAAGDLVTLTVSPATADYQLATISACKTGDALTPVTLYGSGNSRTFNMPAYGVTVTATFINPNQEAVDAAKSLIEGGSYIVAQETANTEADVKTWLAAQINGLPGFDATGITVTDADITLSNFVAAVAGTAGNLSGVNGDFDFKVSLLKGSSSTVANKNGTITATPLYEISIGTFTNGSVSPDKTVATAGETVTLTVAPAAGYELDTISAYKTGDAAIIVQTQNIASLQYTITMPAYGVTVTATFRKTADQIAVETAKSLIEGSYYIVAQATANTEATVKTWLADKINGLPDFDATGITVTEADITLSNFVAAIAGTVGYLSGVNGGFNFTVSLSKGSSSTITISKNGTITATPLYEISIGAVTNGSVSPDKTVATAGETVTLTVAPAAGYELNTISAYRTGDAAIIVQTQNIAPLQYTITMPAYGVTVTATFRKTADQIAVETAKSLIEGGSYTVAQATANTEATVKTWLAAQINGLTGFDATGITVTEADITLSNFVAAIAGTVGNLSGVNGGFNFTVSLSKGSSSTITTSNNGTITATPLYEISVGTFVNGSVSPDKTVATAGETVTLTVAPATGYEPDTISAYKTGDAAIIVETQNIASLQYTITMPAYGVTVTATFRKTADQIAVETAKSLIEGGSYTVAQATANDEATVKTWLAAQINGLTGFDATGITVTEADITLSNFVAAVAGTADNLSGVNGGFDFTVSLSKGSSSTIITSNNGTITATLYVDAQTPNITIQPQSATYTFGDVAADLSVTANVSDGGTLSCQWYFNTTDSDVGGVAITGAINANYTPTTDTAGITYCYVVVTNTNAAPDITGSTTASATSDVVAITVNKASQPASAAPTLASKTTTSITLNIIDGDVQYSIDGVNWQDSPEFSGLIPNTEYTFYARFVEDDAHEASPASEVLTVVTESGSEAVLISLVLNDVGVSVANGVSEYVAGCGENLVRLDMKISPFATVTVDGVEYTDKDIPLIGDVTTVNIVVTSGDGKQVYNHTLRVFKSVDAGTIIIQRFDDLIAINSNPANNGGYDNIEGVRWYHNGSDQVISTEWFITISAPASDYHAEVKIDGSWHRVCGAAGLHPTRVIAYPNPVSSGESLTLQLPSGFVGGYVNIIRIDGSAVKRNLPLPGEFNSVDVSDLSPGIYLLNIVGKTGKKETVKIIKN